MHAIFGIPINKVNRQTDYFSAHYPAMAKAGRPRTKTRIEPGTVGARIRDVREARDLSQGTLASMVGIAQSSLSEIESGETKELLAETLFAICDALGCAPRFILYGDPRSIEESDCLGVYRLLSAERREHWMQTGRLLIQTDADKRDFSDPTTKAKLESIEVQQKFTEILEIAHENGSTQTLRELGNLQSEINKQGRSKKNKPVATRSKPAKNN